MKQHTHRKTDGLITAYDLASGSGALAPAARFTPTNGDRPIAVDFTAGFRLACYTTSDAVVCLSADSTELWRHLLGPCAPQHYVHWPNCAFSPDGRTVWVYRPDVLAGRGPVDRWEVLDTATGEPLDGTELDTAGHGGSQHFHPADGHVLLEVGEGQDGAAVFRASLRDGRLEVVHYPWPDRCLIDLAPDGTQFMTVAHDQTDVTFHRYPDGEELLTLGVDDFEPGRPNAVLEWTGGGYLTDGTAVVTTAGEDEETEEEWYRDHLVDLATGTVGPFASGRTHSSTTTPLGDGSWLLGDPDGPPVRRCGPA
ncbi:hypothetical protein [Kitasatospora sp. NPDC004289]